MSLLADIKASQSSLEESFSKRMAQLETPLHSGGTSKDTVAHISEFRAFRELMFSMLVLLRKQISGCAIICTMHIMENRQPTDAKHLSFSECLQRLRRTAVRPCLVSYQKMGLKGVSPASRPVTALVLRPMNVVAWCWHDFLQRRFELQSGKRSRR